MSKYCFDAREYNVFNNVYYEAGSITYRPLDYSFTIGQGVIWRTLHYNYSPNFMVVCYRDEELRVYTFTSGIYSDFTVVDINEEPSTYDYLFYANEDMFDKLKVIDENGVKLNLKNGADLFRYYGVVSGLIAECVHVGTLLINCHNVIKTFEKKTEWVEKILADIDATEERVVDLIPKCYDLFIDKSKKQEDFDKFGTYVELLITTDSERIAKEFVEFYKVVYFPAFLDGFFCYNSTPKPMQQKIRELVKAYVETG